MPSYLTISFEVHHDNPHVADPAMDMVWNELEKVGINSPHVISFEEVDRSYGTRPDADDIWDDDDDDDEEWDRASRRSRRRKWRR